MRPRFRLRIGILLLLWGFFFLALFLPALYCNNYLKNKITLETRAAATREVSLTRYLMTTREEEFQGPEQLYSWLHEVSDRLKVRITYAAEGGRIVADTDVPFDRTSSLGSQAKRPEIVQAKSRPTGWSLRRGGPLNIDMLYAAQKIEGRGKIPAGFLRVAVPLPNLFYVLDNIAIVQYLVVLAGFILALISLGFMLRTNRSVSLLSSAADSIGQGNVKILPQFHPGQYFYPLAKSIRENTLRVESYIQTITEQKSQLESILDGIEEGILLINSTGRIDSSNRAARNMFSSVPALKGRRPLEVIRSPELQAACNRVLQNEIHSFHSEVAIGADRVYHAHIVRVEQSADEYGAIIALHDISELKRLEKVRRDFVANASHELRTPLTSIKGYTEVLMSDESDPEVRNSCLEVIFKNTNNIIKMVNDLLQLARVEEDYGNMMDIRPVKAIEVLIEACKACMPAAEQRGVSFQNDLPPDGPMVQADFDQLTQVFRNLLENAVRYSPPGGKVEVFSYTQNDQVTIGVSDSGPGIPKKDQQRIFERFFRVERHRGKEAGSTGLGLAICRHIIKNHGGAIWVESPRKDMSSGTTFFFTLPPAAGGNAGT